MTDLKINNKKREIVLKIEEANKELTGLNQLLIEYEEKIPIVINKLLRYHADYESLSKL